MVVSLQSELKKNKPNFSNINKKLNSYILTSNKIANGKSKILIGIKDAANLVQSKIINLEDHALLEEFNRNLSEHDPLMYSAKIWYAKSLFANDKIDKAIEQIEEAIKLSPIEDEPYRLGALIALKSKNGNQLKKFCTRYKSSKFGGKSKRYKNTLFTGLNLNKFGVKFDKNEIYTHNGINLGQFDNYEITPSTPIDVDKISLFFTFNAGTTLELRKIILFSEGGKKEILVRDTIINTNNSFFSSDNSDLLIFTRDDDEVVEVNFKDKTKNVQNILIDMKIDKMNIVNNCKI